jgi:hypothetical protein
MTAKRAGKAADVAAHVDEFLRANPECFDRLSNAAGSFRRYLESYGWDVSSSRYADDGRGVAFDVRVPDRAGNLAAGAENWTRGPQATCRFWFVGGPGRTVGTAVRFEAIDEDLTVLRTVPVPGAQAFVPPETFATRHYGRCTDRVYLADHYEFYKLLVPCLWPQDEAPEFVRAYNFLVRESQTWGWPTCHHDDLATVDRGILLLYQPRTFLWAVREMGTCLILPAVPGEGVAGPHNRVGYDGVDHYQAVRKVWPRAEWYLWEDGDLAHVGSERRINDWFGRQHRVAETK